MLEGLANLGIDMPTLLAQIVNAILLFVLLYFVAWKPLMKMVDKRAEKIKEGLELADVMNQKLANVDQEANKRVEEAIEHEQSILEKAKQDAEVIKQKAQEGSKHEAEEYKAGVRADMQRERGEVIDQLCNDIINLVVLATEKVLGRPLSEEEHRRIVEQVLRGEIKRLKEGINYSVK